MKGTIQLLMVCLICVGAYYVLSAFGEQLKEREQTRWPSVEGHLLSKGDSGSRGVGQLARLATGCPTAGLLAFAFTVPYKEYDYTVNGKKYEQSKSTLPCLSLVRAFFVTKEINSPKPKEESKLNDSALQELSAKIDPATGQPAMLSLQELMGLTAPVVKVYFNPANPEESMPDPEVANFFESILWSGIIMLGAGVLIILAIRYHEFIVSGTTSEEKVPSYYNKMTSQYRR